MSKNPFKLPHNYDTYRILSKIYPVRDIDEMSALEQLEYLLATRNDEGFQYKYKKGDGTMEQRTDYPYLTKNNG